MLQMGLLQSFHKEPVPCEPQTPRGWELLSLQDVWEGLRFMAGGTRGAVGLHGLQIGSVWFYIPAFMSSAGEGTAWFRKIYDAGSYDKCFSATFSLFFLLCKQLSSACQS